MVIKYTYVSLHLVDQMLMSEYKQVCRNECDDFLNRELRPLIVQQPN